MNWDADKKCLDCRYIRLVADSEWGECRLHPPVTMFVGLNRAELGSPFQSHWPGVHPEHDVCGDFVRDDD